MQIKKLEEQLAKLDPKKNESLVSAIKQKIDLLKQNKPITK